MKSILLIILCFSSATSMAEPYFIQCFDFGCKSQQEMRFSQSQWNNIEQLFNTGKLDQKQEKQAIRKAIALMEQYSGEITGTTLDKAGNYPGYDIEKQMDCIDESTNTYQYLVALQDLDYLQWHRVEPKIRRIVWFISHWTAVISEVGTGKRFAVDSWYRDNGEYPYLQAVNDWQKKAPFPDLFNPD